MELADSITYTGGTSIKWAHLAPDCEGEPDGPTLPHAIWAGVSALPRITKSDVYVGCALVVSRTPNGSPT